VEQASLIEGFEPEPNQAPPPNAGNGRPRGARNRKHRELEQYARSRSLTLLTKIVDAAEKGDMAAAKIVMDRIWPKPRTAPIECELPSTETPADVRTAMLDVLQRVSRGELQADDGAALVRMMRDILDAHSIKTLAAGDDDAGANIGDVRELFASRLGRIIEARALPLDDEPGDAAGDDD
jgi:hypothetical protein